jgi:oxygen-dependent protoporphyrinogen oxidase
MVDALVSRLPAERLRLASAVRSVDRSEPSWSVAMADGRRMETRAVTSPLPAHRSAALLASFDPELGRSLAGHSVRLHRDGAPRLPAAPTSRTPLNGYGLIVPKTEGLRTTALSFSSTKLPGRAPEGHVLLRAFLGAPATRRLSPSTTRASSRPSSRR